jgi:hypothetical protein
MGQCSYVPSALHTNPFSPSIAGVAQDERSSVCFGRIQKNSQLLVLEEPNLVGKTVRLLSIPCTEILQNWKLAVMRLDGVDGEGFLCVFLAQPNDRSFRGLQIYRPYEYPYRGDGKEFTSNFMLLTRRNTNNSLDIESVREIQGLS